IFFQFRVIFTRPPKSPTGLRRLGSEIRLHNQCRPGRRNRWLRVAGRVLSHHPLPSSGEPQSLPHRPARHVTISGALVSALPCIPSGQGFRPIAGELISQSIIESSTEPGPSQEEIAHASELSAEFGTVVPLCRQLADSRGRAADDGV